MEIKKQESYCYRGAYDYDFILDNMKLRFFYGGNNDIYFSLQPLDEENDIEHAYVRFTKENYEVYEKFYELYYSLLTGNVYKDSDIDYDSISEFEEEFFNGFNRSSEEKNEDARKYSRWKEFAHEGVVTMMSDNCEEDYANLLRIYIDEDDLVFEFIKKNPCDMFLTFEISTSGSRYQPFEKVFMDLYNKLQSIDLSYHQVHLEELIYSLRKRG